VFSLRRWLLLVRLFSRNTRSNRLGLMR